MHHVRPIEDPARRWRRFCREGGRMAWMFAALWFGLLALLFRVAPAPEPVMRAAPAPVSWWPTEDGRGEPDIRTIWTPSLFALSTPAGFSHFLRQERSRLAPPVQPPRPNAAYVERALPSAPLGFAWDGRIRLSAPGAKDGFPLAAESVFPPRIQERESPRMMYPEGWESRLFSGIDLNFGAWTNSPWSAQIEMRFDRAGVPVSMLLAQSSGLPELDRRLARSANGWRLLEPAAPRAGLVAWISPGTASSAPEPPPRPAAAGKGEP